MVVLCLVVCVSLLSACSKSSGYKWDSGYISGPDGLMDVTEFRGDQAKTTVNGFEMSVYYEHRIMYCSHNYQNVQEDKMNTYKKGKYYTSYNDTALTVYYPSGDGWIEGRLSVEGSSVTDLVAQVYGILSKISLSENITEISIAGVMVLVVDGQSFVMRQNEVIIPQVIRIKENGHDKSMTDMVDIGGVSLAHMSTSDYDYYEYDNYLIQVTKGVDLSMLLKFK